MKKINIRKIILVAVLAFSLSLFINNALPPTASADAGSFCNSQYPSKSAKSRTPDYAACVVGYNTGKSGGKKSKCDSSYSKGAKRDACVNGFNKGAKDKKTTPSKKSKDPVKKAQDTLDKAQKSVKDICKKKGGKSKECKDAKKRVTEAQKKLNEAKKKAKSTLSGASSYSSGAATGACNKGFFGLVPWYKYIKDEFKFKDSKLTQLNKASGNCEIKCFNILSSPQENACGKKGSDIPYVLLAIVDNLLRVAGLVSVAFVLIGSVKYITSQGNPEDTASAQSTIINALIGLAVAIVAVAFISFIGSRIH